MNHLTKSPFPNTIPLRLNIFMKPTLHYPVFALLFVSCVLTGCRTTHKTTHLQNGYEEVASRSRTYLDLDETPPARIALQYMSTNGTLTHIWPSLYGVNEVIHGNIAIFVGDQIGTESGTPLNHPRLFAVDAPALPLDITGEVLSLWAKTTDKNFTKAMQHFSVVSPEETSDGLLLHLEFVSDDYLVVDKDWPDKSDLKLTWSQVTEIMDKVKTKGTARRDAGWHTPYIGERY